MLRLFAVCLSSMFQHTFYSFTRLVQSESAPSTVKVMNKSALVWRDLEAERRLRMLSSRTQQLRHRRSPAHPHLQCRPHRHQHHGRQSRVVVVVKVEQVLDEGISSQPQQMHRPARTRAPATITTPTSMHSRMHRKPPLPHLLHLLHLHHHRRFRRQAAGLCKSSCLNVGRLKSAEIITAFKVPRPWKPPSLN